MSIGMYFDIKSSKIRKAVMSLQDAGWRIKEAGLEDPDYCNEGVQYIILENMSNPRELFYFNIWPGHDHMNDTVMIEPEVETYKPLCDIVLCLHVNALLAISDFAREVTDINDILKYVG